MPRIFLVVLFWFALSPCLHAENIADLGRIVVTPHRFAEDVASVSSDLTVITREMIARSFARTVAGVLEREAGIHIYDKGSAKTTVVDLGGYGDTAASNVLVLVNGRRINPVDISGADLMHVPLGSVERIEVVRGGASVLYGDNATGGVINIITQEGAGPARATVFAEAGSYGAQRYGAGVSGAEAGLSYRVYSEYGDIQGYRDNSQLLSKDGMIRLSYDIIPQVRLGLEGGWHEDDYGLPGGISAEGLAANGRRGSTHPEDHGRTKDRFVRLSADILPFDAEHGKVTVDVSRRDRDTYGWYDYGVWGATSSERAIVTDMLGLKYAAAMQVFERAFSLVAGIDHAQARNRIRGGGEGMSASTDDLTVMKKELGVYVLGEYGISERLRVNAGARHERAAYVFDRDDMPFYAAQDPRETLFSGGIKYAYAPGSNVFAGVQETFRFLATDEWYDTWSGLNTELRQQTGIEYQVGVKHSFGGAYDVQVTPFYAVNHDEIFLDPTLGGAGKNSNYGRTRRAGVNFGQTLHVMELLPGHGPARLARWDIFTNYTCQDPVFDGGKFDGKNIPMVPRHALSAGMDMAWAGGFSWNLAARFTGAQYAINDTANATARMRPYTVVDTRFTYAMKGGTELYWGVSNLFNTLYDSYVVKSASGTNKDYFPAPGRHYVAGVSFKF